MTTANARPMQRAILRRVATRRLRFASGAVMFVYIVAHLVNHALGLVSLRAAEAGLRVATSIWHSAPGTVLLYGSVAAHVALALNAVYERRTLRMPAGDAVRIVLGFAIPLQLIAHFTVTRLAYELYGVHADYHRVVWSLVTGGGHARQLALLASGWLHGCFGLNRAFDRYAFYRRLRPALFVAVLSLPFLAAGGFLAMGHELAALASRGLLPDAQVVTVDAAGRVALGGLRDGLVALYGGLIAFVFVARALRSRLTTGFPAPTRRSLPAKAFAPTTPDLRGRQQTRVHL